MEAAYRHGLPQLGGDLFLSDGGIETYLIFHRGLDLPEFAAFDLLKDQEGRDELRDYYRPFLAIAAERDLGFVLESPTWRSNRRWGEAIGYEPDALAIANHTAVALMEELREEATEKTTIVISGCIGPHDDGYSPDEILDADAARRYHSEQIGTFADTAADQITAITMTYADEALGIARAANEAGVPAAISFTVETDGRLPSGQPLADAVAAVDDDPDTDVAYFMVNCAHPSHFEDVVGSDEPWVGRIRGVRANASMMSHAELDEATELDEGDPADLGASYRRLYEQMPSLNVFGGCCGTDARHVAAIRDAIIG
jgi:S-methylmethionine-dependent homocysteine/selenocysteine methylase